MPTQVEAIRADLRDGRSEVHGAVLDPFTP